MSTLRLIGWALCTPALTLAFAEVLRHPRWFICDCRSVGYGWNRQAWHLKSVWLFTIGACYIASDVFVVAAGGRYPTVAALGALYLWRWWRHRGNGKRLKDKVLGVVRATAAGLKVVPVPQR